MKQCTSQIMTEDGTPIPLQDGKELVLKYDDRDFKIRFGTDHFSVGNDLSYQASLEGKVVHRSPSVAVPVWRSGALNAGVIYSLFAPRIVTAWKAMSSNLLSLSSHPGTAQSGWSWSGDRCRSRSLSLHPLADLADGSRRKGVEADG